MNRPMNPAKDPERRPNNMKTLTAAVLAPVLCLAVSPALAADAVSSAP